MARTRPPGADDRMLPWQRIVGVYVVVALLWIGLSDVVLFRAVDDGFAASMGKGVLFVLLTATLLALLLRRGQQRLDVWSQRLDERDRALDARSAELRLLDELSDDLVFRYAFEPQPRFTFVSAAATRMVGYSPQEHYDDPDLRQRIVHPNDRHLLDASPSMDGPLQLRWQHREGRMIFTEQRSTLELVDGRPVALVGSARDVTEQVLAAAGRELASQLDADVADDRPLDEALAALGRALAELTAAVRVTVDTADAWGQRTSVVQSAASDGLEVSSEVTGRSQTTVVEVALAATSPSQQAVASMLPPLAERIATAVERARHSLERHRLERALLATGSGVILADREGRIEWVNPAFTDISGYTLDEVRGSTPRIVKSGKQKPAFYDQLWATITAGRPFAARVVNRRKDGSQYVAQVTIDPVQRGDGEVVGFIGVQKDVTADEQRRDRLHERETAALERERDLVHDRSLLVQLLSHELRTPLTILVGSARTLERAHLDADVREQLLDALSRATDDVLERLGALIAATDDLGGRVEMLALDELVRSLTGSLAKRFDAHRVQVEGAAHWTGDAILAQAVLRPVVENALKFSPSDAPVHIRLSATGVGAAQVAVSDQGAGIDPGVLELLEQPFRQQDPTTTRERGGLGLGLYVARRAADRLGASLEIDSTPAGTTVVVGLPLTADPPATADVPGADPPATADVPGADPATADAPGADPATADAPGADPVP